MRFPEEGEDLTGKVCVCSVGRSAIVTHKGSFTVDADRNDAGREIECWMGLGLDGKGTWASTAPVIIAENGKEFHDKLRKRFGGKTG